MPALMNKNQIVRERERQSLHLSARLIRGKSDFGLYWTNRETSYTDGEDLFIFTEPSNAERTYTPAEARTIRKGHTYHEVGHKMYDNIQDYRAWCVAQAKTYPGSWVKFFGNTSVDGRMEHYLTTDYPRTQDYIDFMNYEWCFGNREATGDRVRDFRFIYMHYSLGMTISDVDDLNEDALELCDSIKDRIEEFRISDSTKDCLNIVTDIMSDIWDTIKEWMEEDKKDGEDPNEFSDMKGMSHESTSSWGDSDEERTERNNQRASKKVTIKITGKAESDEEMGEGGEPTSGEAKLAPNNSDDSKDKPDFSAVVQNEESSYTKDETEAQEQEDTYSQKEEEVKIDYEYQKDRVAYSDKVITKPFPQSDITRFNSVALDVKAVVKPLGKTLKDLLKPIPDKKLKNQKQGRLKAARAWRAVTLDDPHIFERKRQGTPAEDACILFMNDCSGSTGCSVKNGETIMDQMRKSLILGVLAAEEANIPCGAFGFHEDRDTEIFPLKPFNRKLGQEEKGFLGGLKPYYGNRDTLALQWSINQLDKRDESVKILFMISDGQPCFSGQENESTMTALVKQAHKKGIDVLCLYVGPLDSYAVDAVKGMYPNGAIIVDNPAQLPRVMGTHVKRIIRQRRS